jgi:glyoxylase-like metal-dependent hydrolase (beta-lactamase superfamily II)
MDSRILTRRHLIAAAAALGAASAPAPCRSLAKTPMPTQQVPAFYRFKIGSMNATVVSDGDLAVGDPTAIFGGIEKEQIKGMLQSKFLPLDQTPMEENVLVLDTGAKLVMFDAGMGHSTLFGKTSGRLLANLKAAGIDPNDIDAVVISHAHSDHCWGLIDAAGKSAFPNAQIYMSEADFDFWTDEAKMSIKTPLDLAPFIKGAREALLPHRDRMVFFKDGQEFLPGIQAMAAPGHTVGHTIFIVSSAGQSLAVTADLTHHPVLLMEVPRMFFVYDTDTAQSVATRGRVLDMLAAQRMPLIAYHFPWPGIGNVAKAGEGFRYYPSQLVMQPT